MVKLPAGRLTSTGQTGQSRISPLASTGGLRSPPTLTEPVAVVPGREGGASDGAAPAPATAPAAAVAGGAERCGDGVAGLAAGGWAALARSGGGVFAAGALAAAR